MTCHVSLLIRTEIQNQKPGVNICENYGKMAEAAFITILKCDGRISEECCLPARDSKILEGWFHHWEEPWDLKEKCNQKEPLKRK